jgi:ABC-2 type transport system ATP-binding protein
MQIGDIAAVNNIVLHELSPQTGSLEQAFLDATDASVEFRGETGSSSEGIK